MIDCLDGMPVSWTIGTSPNSELANTMLKNAIATLDSGEKPIVHSDRGCHYRWTEWIRIMEDAGLTRTMSKKGRSPDNSACEGFFGHLKTEMFYGRNWNKYSIEEFIQEVDDYMHWYCKERNKSTLGGLSPLEYRRSMGEKMSARPLDEPTAALDPVAEYEIYRKFAEISDRKLTVYISHRINSTRFCDKIAVFENGEITEYGSFDELMELKGLYYNFFETQAELYK